MRFEDLNDYVLLGVFEYLDFYDRIIFERVHSRWKDLIRKSTTELKDKYWRYGIYQANAFEIRVDKLVLKYENLKTLPIGCEGYFMDEDYFTHQLPVHCPNLETFSIIQMSSFADYIMHCKTEPILVRNVFFRYGKSVNDHLFRCAINRCSKLEKVVVTDDSTDELTISDHISEVETALEKHKNQIKVLSFLRSRGQISKFSNLTRISTQLSSVTSSHLQRLKHLKELTIKRSTHFDGPPLQGVTGLTLLHLDNNSVPLRFFLNLIRDNSTTLETLDIDYKFVEDPAFFDEQSISDVFSALQNSTKLIQFSFVYPVGNYPDLELPFLARNPKLRSLDCRWRRDSSTADLADVLSVCPKLRYLEMHMAKPTDGMGGLLLQYAKNHPKRKIRFDCHLSSRDAEDNDFDVDNLSCVYYPLRYERPKVLDDQPWMCVVS